MKKLMHFMFLSCTKATELIDKELFIGLTFREKVQLMLHKSMCEACTRYSHQSAELDKYLHNNIQNYSPHAEIETIQVSEDYKEKLIKTLEEV